MTNTSLPGVSVAGSLLLLMILIAIGNGIDARIPLWPAAIAAWLAATILFRSLSRSQRIQVSTIGGIGILLMLIGGYHGATVSPLAALEVNIRLLSMIAAVGFLRLVAIPRTLQTTSPPTGQIAYLRTLLAVFMLGSVINVSAPLLVADRLSIKGRLTRLAAQSITRVFSGCSAWSPFFGGMATVITYVEDARLAILIIAGFPFAVVGLAVVATEAHYRYRSDVQQFHGYPMSYASLRVPIILAIAVLVLYQIGDGIPVLTVIAVASLLVTVVLLIYGVGLRAGMRALSDHIRSTLSRMGGELILFLAAGLLAAGLAVLVDMGWITLTLTQFNATTASVLLGAMLILSAAGIHPVILVAGLTPLLSKLVLQPELLAVTYLLAWSIGTGASPLSGTHLIFQGRYGIPSWRAAMWNWPFAVVMYVVGVALLHIVAAFLTS